MLSTHMNSVSSSGLELFPSLAEQDGGPSTHTHTELTGTPLVPSRHPPQSHPWRNPPSSLYKSPVHHLILPDPRQRLHTRSNTRADSRCCTAAQQALALVPPGAGTWCHSLGSPRTPAHRHTHLLAHGLVQLLAPQPTLAPGWHHPPMDPCDQSGDKARQAAIYMRPALFVPLLLCFTTVGPPQII